MKNVAGILKKNPAILMVIVGAILILGRLFMQTDIAAGKDAMMERGIVIKESDWQLDESLEMFFCCYRNEQITEDNDISLFFDDSEKLSNEKFLYVQTDGALYIYSETVPNLEITIEKVVITN